MGIYTDYIGHITPFDQEKYPYLLRFKDPFMEDPYDEPPYIEEYAKKHFISMLQYQKDNPEFLKMVEGQTIGIDGEPIKEWTKAKIDYIEKNGLKVYGFAVDATKEVGLVLGNITYVISDNEKGVVENQDPPAGTNLGSGSSIDITINEE